ncbi:MAG: decaprenyl-phosphate phosphoribosyltransferase [Nannocystaceae bacterium]|nr:decaprenyl-phosphate phosphoribosyltransferase [Myxococcales bacterium]
MFFALLQTLRPKQWIKNLFVGVPLMFGQKLTDPTSLLITAGAIGLFCLVSGCVYILNDLVDLEKDRAHPKKRHRPLPSGRLSPTLARNFAVITVAVCLALGYYLEPLYALILGVYLANNVAYSFKVKHVAYLDVLSIAFGFLLRVLAGAAALELPPSPWLLGCMGLLATFLGFGKRAHELGAGEDQARKQRAVLEHYSPGALRWIMHSLAVVTIAVYVLYTTSEHVEQLFHTHLLPYTAVFGIVGVLRFNYLATTRHDAESPTEEMLKDPLFMGNFLLWVVSIAAILYGWI